MITTMLKNKLEDVIINPDKYTSGSGRKELQAAFDLLLDQVSNAIFNSPCQSRMSFRAKLNNLDISKLQPQSIKVVQCLLEALKNADLLYDKTYDDRRSDIETFIENHLTHILDNI